MSITIKRNTGWIGMGTNIQIKLNGKKVAKVGENTQIEVELPEDKACLKIKHVGVKSNEIEVKEGDVIEIKQTKWYKWSFPLYFVFLILSMFIFDPTKRLMIVITIGILYLISLFIKEGYYLKVINER